jgi:hypothetical protein
MLKTREESGPSGTVASRRTDESRDTRDAWRIDPLGFRENLGRILNERLIRLIKSEREFPNSRNREYRKWNQEKSSN